MIYITKTEEEVYLTYLQTKSVDRVAYQLCKTKNTIGLHMRSLTANGLFRHDPTSNKQRYFPTNAPYTVINGNSSNELKKRQHVNVLMTPQEIQWMHTHYPKYRRNRSEAARILGRTRGDICLMAQALDLHIKEAM